MSGSASRSRRDAVPEDPARNLIREPLASPEHLGRPIPDDLHACSMALPRWRDVVGYEEGTAEVHDRLANGYPRFVFHPLVRELMAKVEKEHASRGEQAFVFPSLRAAQECATYVQRKTGSGSRTVPIGLGIVATIAADSVAEVCKAYWQHSGKIVSSRRAAAALSGGPAVPDDGAERKATLRQRIADLYGASAADVSLFPTGMAAIHAASRVIERLRPGRPRIQAEFPYLDTLRVHREFATEAMLRTGDEAVRTLEGSGLAPGAVFTEVPSNPLLRTADLQRLADAVHASDGFLVVDDTVATPVNVDITPWADLIVSSLTKSFCGGGDVMAGALVVNPVSRRYGALRDAARADFEDLLWEDDAAVLERRSRNFSARVHRATETATRLAGFLQDRPEIQTVFHPSLGPDARYERIRRPDGGYGSLLSFLPANPAAMAPRIYDALDVSKGPSLGTDFTLACPYTLIAHYRELDWAETHGVSRWLLRVSVGLEDFDDLQVRFSLALSRAQAGGSMPGDT